MRLSDFIVQHMDAILAEWEAFAATLLPAARNLDAAALRDHAQQILEAVARDLTTPQTRLEQSEKSRGRAPMFHGAPETAAQTHAVLRARGDFDIIQLVAEYRALRASVLRLWMDQAPLDRSAVEDMMRFNEAIDQAIAESVGQFHGVVERYRNLLLGMLGHDMRTPLDAIVATAAYLGALNAGEAVSDAAARLIRSGASMQALLDDLTDFNRTNLGVGLNVVASDIDLAGAVGAELDQLRAAYPRRQIAFAASGDSHGRWDAGRLQQVIRNLVSNAVQYGSPGTPIRVTMRGEEASVFIDVSNSGHLDPSSAGALFDPLRRGARDGNAGTGGHGLGLGLFIVREIVRAHGGEVEARSRGDETTFSVRLPRKAGVRHRGGGVLNGDDRSAADG